MSIKKEILAKINTIPAIPSAATQAIHLLQDDDSDMNEIVEIVKHDPALTANLLRVCNSSEFGSFVKFTSIHDSLIRLGTRRVLKLIMASAVGPSIGQPLRGYDLPAGGLWEYSVAVALGTEELAAELDLPQDPMTFTAALLHDIGKIVLSTFMVVDAAPIVELATNRQISFEAAEREILGIDHAEVGAKLLELWNLPAEIVEIVRYHHEPDRLEEPSWALDLVHVADVLAMESGIGAGIDGLNYRVSPDVHDRLKLNNSVLECAMCSVLTRLSEMQSLFNPEERGCEV